MGERRTFPALLGRLDRLTNTELSEALDEIVSGCCYFGSRDEWRDWHHYLLVQRFPRMHEHYSLLAVFISGLFGIYPDGVADPALRRDLLLTVGRSLMEPACWPQGQIDPEYCLSLSLSHPNEVSYWKGPSNKLSAAIFFCMKHLALAEVAPWMRSVVEIADPLWRAQLLSFAAEAHPILDGHGAADGHLEGDTVHGVYWDGTEKLAGAIEVHGWLPSQENRTEAKLVLRDTLNRDLATWSRAIELAYPAVWKALDDVPTRCAALYAD